MASVFYLLCVDPGCTNEARYWESVGPGVIYLRWCGIHDILRNGGRGKLASGLHSCATCPPPTPPTNPTMPEHPLFFTVEELAAHERTPLHRDRAEAAAFRSKLVAAAERRREGRRR